MDKRIIQDLKNTWRNVNQATIGFANSVPSANWSSRPFAPRFKAFAWEFACLTRTRMCYLKALRTGILKFSPQEDILDKQTLLNFPKNEIVTQLQKLAREILSEITKIDSPQSVKLIYWLFQHERLHHGKLILYHSQAGFKLPKSFVKTWGESNFIKAQK